MKVSVDEAVGVEIEACRGVRLRKGNHMKVRSSLVAGGLAAALVVLPSCGGGGGGDKVGFVGSPDGPATTVKPAAGSYRVGDVVRVGETEVVVHSFKDRYDAGTQKPPAGSHYATVDVEVRNRSAAPQIYSSFAQLAMRNVKGKSFDPVGVPGSGEALSGQAPPGGSRRGMVAFQIPDSSQGLLLVFTDRVLNKGSASIYLA